MLLDFREQQLVLAHSIKGECGYFSLKRVIPVPVRFICCSIPENISGEILKAVQSIFPMQNVYIRKVKALKKPKFDCEFFSLEQVDSQVESRVQSYTTSNVTLPRPT